MRFHLLAISLLALSGCGLGDGPQRVAVHGTVRLDGVLLEKGAIVFIPQGDTQGPKAWGAIRQGTYDIPEAHGPVAGSQRVEIRSVQDLNFPLDDPEAFRRQPGPDLPPDPIPEQYNDSSTLVIEASPGGENQFDFNLTTTN